MSWYRLIMIAAIIILVPPFINLASAGGEELDCEAARLNILNLLQNDVAPLLRPNELKYGKSYIRKTLPEELKIQSTRLLDCSTLSKKLGVRDGKEITTDFMGAYIHVSVLKKQLEILLESQDQGVLRDFLESGFVKNIESTYTKIDSALTSPPSM